jgi:predicted Zn-dependent protease with MMP-like domain
MGGRFGGGSTRRRNRREFVNRPNEVTMRLDWQKLHALAREEVQATLAALPAPLRERAQALPVTFERHPNAAQRRDGIEPDTLGLFVGPEFADEETTSVPLPPQIILYLENIWDLADADEEVFREEVHTTYLHELGHYLGLDEEDLFDRGLE